MRLWSLIIVPFGLSACSTTPDPNVTAAQHLPLVSVVEMGDTTKPCEQLSTEIKALEGDTTTLKAALSSLGASDASADATSSYAVSTAYAGSYGGTIGPLQQMFSSMSDQSRGQEIQQIGEKYDAAKQRRDALTAIYNERCF
jgi:hypothetical protein